VSKVIRSAHDLPEPIDGVINIEPGTIFDFSGVLEAHHPMKFKGTFDFRFHNNIESAPSNPKDYAELAINQSCVASLLSNH